MRCNPGPRKDDEHRGIFFWSRDRTENRSAHKRAAHFSWSSLRLGGETAMSKFQSPTEDPLLLRVLLSAVAIGFVALFLVLPLVIVFKEAFARGLGAFWATIVEPDALAAVRLSLLVAAIAVPFNTLFGVAASWAI